ncbi:hypothetical protein COCCADRAFT_23027 [Bipolaris zeicola 26-R-13]|uniref:Cytochrome P450 monooxygenase n=1 Tax=Cochliobolus carbonum (strain 26-R-13) TaxID=930089 RepID=W6YP67_COCC2|nr:uncharacterized protein COCCADRAFT_23027 [Bipolaris zeicola 26-R-13]EUC37309.1 hypothetical protein COCCADRAFT_23027 [Bipolaris zeicola 26-R-13]
MFLESISDRVGFEVVSAKGLVFSSAIFLASIAIYVLGCGIYNIFFHPLRHIPGPLLARAGPLPYVLRARNGRLAEWTTQLHEKYGDVVRVAPNEVSFTAADSAWSDIYGFRTGKYKGTGSYLKDKAWYPQPVSGVPSLLSADEEGHSRMRRNLSHLFSEKSLRQQESLLQGYVDLLVQRMGEHAARGEIMDVVRWYNFITFDIIADLAFGESLYCLRDSENHEWVSLVYSATSVATIMSTRRKYGFIAFYDWARNLFQDTMQNEKRRREFSLKASAKVSERLAQLENGDDDKPDFFGQLMRNRVSEEKRLSRAEMDANAVTFLTAGSETTATTLSGFTYFVLRRPEIYAKMVQEIRSAFTSLADINVEKATQLPYLTACIQETLRMYPPVPTGFPRVVPQGGANISGHYISGGTSVYVSQYAMHHSSRHFKNPDEFVPERWLEGANGEYSGDKKDGFNPFSFGPRNCIGKNLAWAELRLIISSIFFAFDFELVDKEIDWMAMQEVFTLWKKPGLTVRLKAVSE